MLLDKYCQRYHPDIEVIRPDFNRSPDIVFKSLCDEVYQSLESIKNLKPSFTSNSYTPIQKYEVDSANFKLPFDPNHGNQTVLMGSSLGGYFASLVSNATGCPALLLNPSIQPHISLKRFLDKAHSPLSNEEMKDIDDRVIYQTVIYQTKGGWELSLADLAWFQSHQLTQIDYPKRLYVVLKTGDELLDSNVSEKFFRRQGVTVDLQKGGDHRMSDFKSQLPTIMSHLLVLEKEGLFD